jgi:hypothetical protein
VIWKGWWERRTQLQLQNNNETRGDNVVNQFVITEAANPNDGVADHTSTVSKQRETWQVEVLTVSALIKYP